MTQHKPVSEGDLDYLFGLLTDAPLPVPLTPEQERTRLQQHALREVKQAAEEEKVRLVAEILGYPLPTEQVVSDAELARLAEMLGG